MIPETLRAFIYKLYEETEKKNLTWHEAAFNNAYFCDHKDITLHISYYFDPDREESSYTFRITSNGKSTPFTVTDAEKDFKFINDLYDIIVANANNVEEAIKGFFD